jgi:ferrous iron transport protein A
MMPLSMAKPGKKLEVTGFRGGFGMRRRLADLGVNIGMEISIVTIHQQGPMLVLMKGSRFAIGRGIAHHIYVKPK